MHKFAILFLLTILTPLLHAETTKTVPAAVQKLMKKHDLEDAKVGYCVYDLTKEKSQAAFQEKALFNPASTTKLLTAYSLLRKVGPSFTFETRLAGTAVLKPRMSIYEGDIYLIGGGDPSLTWVELDRMAASISAHGITAIKGNLIVDATIFDSLAMGKGWMWDEGASPSYSRISGLSVDEGCLKISLRPCGLEGDTVCYELYPPTLAVSVCNNARIGRRNDSLRVERRWQRNVEVIDVNGIMGGTENPEGFYLSVENPAVYAGWRLAELLAHHGVTLTGTVKAGKAPDNLTTLHTIHSKNLDRLMVDMLRFSNNFYAECFLKTLAVEGGAEVGTATAGVAQVRKILGGDGLDTLGWRMVDGSGVSRYNLITPNLLVDVLSAAWRDFRIQPEFAGALSVAGGEGTMCKRFSDEKGWVRAKTGSLTGVIALAGYFVDGKGHTCAFSILVQDFIGPLQSARDFQDELVKYWQDQ